MGVFFKGGTGLFTVQMCTQWVDLTYSIYIHTNIHMKTQVFINMLMCDIWYCLLYPYFFGCILHTIYHGFRSTPILCPNFIWVATMRSVHQAKLEVNRAPKFNRRLAESRNTDNYFNKVIWRNTRTGSTPDQYTLVAHLLGTLNRLQFAPEMGAPQQLRGLASSWLERSGSPASRSLWCWRLPSTSIFNGYSLCRSWVMVKRANWAGWTRVNDTASWNWTK